MSALCAQSSYQGMFCQPLYQRYHLVVGGACDNFVPNAGYWCYTEDYGYPDPPKIPLGPGTAGSDGDRSLYGNGSLPYKLFDTI